MPAPATQEPEPPSYGTMRPVTSADGVFAERVSDKLVSTILAFLVPLVLGFALEAEDKSSMALAGHQFSTGMTFGAAMGFMLAVMIAAGFGYIAERQMDDQRLLFLVSTALLALSVISLSQALMHLGAASLEPHEVLLSFLSVVRGPGR